MTMWSMWGSLLFLLWPLCGTVWGHGRLLEPPSRTSMWRFGYNSPPDYDDNGHNCGGVGVQFGKNNGRCGLCGDPYDGYRASEAGGKFAQGIIPRTYEMGGVLNILVQITANHKGFFEFHLCPNNNPKLRITQECLDRYPLPLLNGETRFYLTKSESHNNFTLSLKLPPGLTCSQCVLQWKYTAGNTYNCDRFLGKCCTGCGSQEQFYACADIAIISKDDEGSYLPDTTGARPKTTPTSTRPPTTTTKPPPHFKMTTTTPPPRIWTRPSTRNVFPPKYSRGCHARADLKPHEQFNNWCKVMCQANPF